MEGSYRYDRLLVENTYSINTKWEWNEMSSVTWEIPFHSTCENIARKCLFGQSKGSVHCLTLIFLKNSACDEIFERDLA